MTDGSIQITFNELKLKQLPGADVSKSREEKLLLIGPLPPPFGGTTIPFQQYTKFLQYQLKNTSSIINSNTGDKSVNSLLHLPTLFLVIQLLIKVTVQSLRHNKIILFGSQNFCTITGSLLAILCAPTHKELHIRIIGGGYKEYFINSSKFRKLMIKRLLNRASSITVETKLVFDFMCEHWKNIHYVPNYRELPSGVVNPRSKPARKIRFLYVGQIKEEKGITILLKAFNTLLKELDTSNSYPSIHLDLVGPIDNYGGHSFDTTTYDTDGKIVFHGSVDPGELRAYYEQASFFIFPTFWGSEGQPGAVIEAMSYGLPVVTTRWGSMGELVEHGENGWLCEPADEASLTKAMRQSLDFLDSYSHLSNNAFEKSKTFDRQKAFTKFVHIHKLTFDQPGSDNSVTYE